MFVIQREDCNKFSVAKDIDPEYSKTFKIAINNNVKILCYDCKFSSKGIKLNKEIKFQLMMMNYKKHLKNKSCGLNSMLEL